MKEKNKKGSYAEGYISFDPEDLKRNAGQEDPNAEAYELLWEATCTSSHVSKKDKEGGVTDLEDVYPITAEETAQMEGLLNEAEKALKDPSDKEFREKAAELRGIIEWSKKRHWMLNWRVILGVIISVFILQTCVSSRNADVKEEESKIKKIENWDKADTTYNIKAYKKVDITEYLEKGEACSWERRYDNVMNYLHYTLAGHARIYAAAEQEIENYKRMLDTVTSKERKQKYQEDLEKQIERRKESEKFYKEFRDASLKELQKRAEKSVEGDLAEAKGAARVVKFWNLFFLLLIPVYIFASRPHGYTITRHRKEAKFLGWIERIGLWLSGGLLGASLGIGFVDVVTKWSDGSVTRSDDGTGPARLAIKVGLLVAAVLVFCAVSCFLMLYATITGLKRNYDWSAVRANAAKAGAKAKAEFDKQREAYEQSKQKEEK